jgi:signal transduction histidine kinase/FixJ family two-component response regulator
MDRAVLLVDDEEGIRKVLGLLLTDMGYSVHAAESGEAALDIFKRIGPAIVMTDIKMPGMDGIELLQRIKQASPDTEVIMITGHGDMDLAVKSLKFEATDFITKPINDEALEIALKRANERLFLRGQLQRYTKELERLVEEKSARYQMLFDEAPCYISVQDNGLHIVAANRRFKEDFGEAVGSCCHQIYRRRNEPCIGCPVVQTFGDGLAHQAEMVVNTQNGRALVVLVNTAPIRDADGKVIQVMELLTDITQLHRLQDQLSSLGLLIGDISHGIKGLLTGLDAGMYLLNSGMSRKDHGQIKEGWDVVSLMIERIRGMVQNILYYAKDRSLQWEATDALSLAKEVAFTFEPKIRDRDIEFVCRFDPTVGAFEVDAGIMRAALINLLENAVDACLEDRRSGKVHRIDFAVGHDAAAVIWTVADNGIGMDELTRSNIFNLFFSSKGSRGTGLGLYITHQTVHRHGGRIDVNAAPHSGTTFVIHMPKTLSAEVKSRDMAGSAPA